MIYDALWNGAANTADPVVPAADWASISAFTSTRAGRTSPYGGDTINIDQDYLDVQRQALAGGSAQASPAVAQPTGAVSAFFRGVDGQLWRDSFTPGAGWQHPASMGGSLATRPSAVTSVPGTVAVFAKGTDGRLGRRSASRATAGRRCARCTWAGWAAARPRWPRPTA